MNGFFALLRNNWKSGLTVAFISLPLSLSLAIASGATPTQGIITAIWAGFFGAIFGGSHFNIIGPTGALSGILIGYTIMHGFSALPFVTLVSGIFMLLAFAFHLDRYIIFIPRSVVHGFTLGVALLIGLGQIDSIFGLQNVEKGEHALDTVFLALRHFSEFDFSVFLLFLLGTGFIFLWNKKFPAFPGALVLAAIGIIFSKMMHAGMFGNFSLQTLSEKYPNLSARVFENIWSGFSWDLFFQKDFWTVSLAVAIIGILETLLSGWIAEGKTGVPFRRQKEVFGLGIANIASGICGGIPATAALARTSLNIKSGATHKTSGALNSAFLLVIAFFLLPSFAWLPLVVVASILVFVAISMVEKKHFIHFLENEKLSFWLSLGVAIITVAEDPIMGVLVGTVIALLIFVNNVAKGQTEVLLWKDGKMTEALLKNEFIEKQENNSDLVVYKISGALTYINMPAHLEAVQKIKGNAFVIVSLRHSFYIDTDGVDYLREIIEILKANNQKVFLCGVNAEIEKRIKKEEFYKRKLIEKKIYTRTSEVIRELYGKETPE